MADQKPRYGGAAINMDDMYKQVDTSQSDEPLRGITQSETYKQAEVDNQYKTGNTHKSTASSQAEQAPNLRETCTDHNGVGCDISCLHHIEYSDKTVGGRNVAKDIDNIESLRMVFTALGIKAELLPYTRYQNSTLDNKLNTSEGFSPPRGDNAGLDLDQLPKVVYCKNLFLKDRRGQFFIVVCPEDVSVDLKALKQQLGAHRNLSFADNEALCSVLNLKPGEVTPLAVMHKSAQDVKVAIHGAFVDAGVNQPDLKFAFHPLRGDLQVNLSYTELDIFLRHFGKTVQVIRGERCVEDCKHVHSHSTADNLTSTRCTIKHAIKEAETNSEKRHSYSPTPDDTSSYPANNAHAPLLHSQYPLTFAPEKLVSRPQDRPGQDERFPKSAYRQTHRKGKLASYIRRNERSEMVKKADIEVVQHASPHEDTTDFAESKDNCDSQLTHQQAASKNCVYGVSTTEPNQEDDRRVIADEEPPQIISTSGRNGIGLQGSTPLKSQRSNKQAASRELSTAHQTKPLPEISRFYASLSEAGANYKEVEVSSSIEPSVGCRCFLFKDRRDNFFFVISHDMYLPDFGRLKAALKPRKKLMAADPTEVTSFLGVDPARITPFAALTARHAQLNIFLTRKVTSPNLVFCIQHPYASGRRMIMTSGAVQKLLEFCQWKFEVVEEKMWAEKYNFPFSQFEVSQNGQHKAPVVMQGGANHKTREHCINSSSGEEGKVKVKLVKNRKEKITQVPVFSWLKPQILSLKSIVERANNTGSFFYVATPIQCFQISSLLSQLVLTKLLTEPPPKVLCCSTSVDPHYLSQYARSTDCKVLTKDGNKLPSKQEDKEKVNPFIAMTTGDLIKHLQLLGIKFRLCKQHPQQHASSSPPSKCELEPEDGAASDRCAEDDDIVEKCDVMHLQDEANGDTFLIIAAEEEFPISVRRFCCKCRLQGRLHILSEPQGMSKGRVRDKDPDMFGSEDKTSTNMLPFSLAERTSRSRSIEHGATSHLHTQNASHPSESRSIGQNASTGQSESRSFGQNASTGQSESRTIGQNASDQPESRSIWENASDQSESRSTGFLAKAEQSCSTPRIVFVLTTTLYIDPETIMEFRIGSDGSRLQIESSEFEKYAKELGFEVWYF